MKKPPRCAGREVSNEDAHATRMKNIVITMQTMLESSPEWAHLFCLLNSLSGEEKEEIFSAVSIRMQNPPL